jgi:hypothetical protein
MGVHSHGPCATSLRAPPVGVGPPVNWISIRPHAGAQWEPTALEFANLAGQGEQVQVQMASGLPANFLKFTSDGLAEMMDVLTPSAPAVGGIGVVGPVAGPGAGQQAFGHGVLGLGLPAAGGQASGANGGLDTQRL